MSRFHDRERLQDLGLEPAGVEEREYLGSLVPGADEVYGAETSVKAGRRVGRPHGSAAPLHPSVADELHEREVARWAAFLAETLQDGETDE